MKAQIINSRYNFTPTDRWSLLCIFTKNDFNLSTKDLDLNKVIYNVLLVHKKNKINTLQGLYLLLKNFLKRL